MLEITCPVCGSSGVVMSLVANDPSIRCSRCEATWEQHGGRQSNVRPGKLRGVPERQKRGLAVFPMGE
jgi:hypothetical protein